MTDCTFIGKTDEIVFCPANNLYKAVGWSHSAFHFLNLNKTKHTKKKQKTTIKVHGSQVSHLSIYRAAINIARSLTLKDKLEEIFDFESRAFCLSQGPLYAGLNVIWVKDRQIIGWFILHNIKNPSLPISFEYVHVKIDEQYVQRC